MGCQLHVSNLPDSASERSLAAYFASCGEVSEVRIVVARATAQSQSFALITMKTERAAEHAVKSLDGSVLEGRALRVCVMQGRVLALQGQKAARFPPGLRARVGSSSTGAAAVDLNAGGETAVAKPRAERVARLVPDSGRGRREAGRGTGDTMMTTRITQQFRERHNMRYELDCSGVPLIVRVFFPNAGASASTWRIEAMTSDATGSPVAQAHAASRAEALQMIAEAWHETMPPTSSKLDWTGIAEAMTAVRAL